MSGASEKQESGSAHPDVLRRNRSGDEGSNLADTDDQESQLLAETADHKRTLLLFANGRLELLLHDGEQEQPILLGRYPELQIDTARFSPDGSRFLTVSRDGTVRVFLSVGGPPFILQGTYGRDVLAARYLFNADSTRVVLKGPERQPGVLLQWRVIEGAGARVPGPVHYDCRRSKLVPAGFAVPRKLPQGIYSQDAKWRIDRMGGTVIKGTREPIKLHGFEDPGGIIGFSTDSSRLLTCTDSGKSYIWDFAGALLRKKLWLATGLCLSVDRRMTLLGEASQQAAKNRDACIEMVRCLGISANPRGTELPLSTEHYESCLASRHVATAALELLPAAARQ